MRAFYWQLIAAVGFAVLVLISIFVGVQVFLDPPQMKGQKEVYVFSDCPEGGIPTTPPQKSTG